MEITIITAIVGSACAVVGGVVGALGALLAARSWVESRFRLASECDRVHDAAAASSRALGQTVDRLGDRVEALGVQVHGLETSVGIFGERMTGALGRIDDVIGRLNGLIAVGCPYGGGRSKEGC